MLFNDGIEELHGIIAGADGGTGLVAKMGVKMIAKESAHGRRINTCLYLCMFKPQTKKAK
jgi:hypothetical protein